MNITDQIFEPFNTFCMQTAHLSPKQKLNNELDKTIFLTEALIEQCNNDWKVNSLENNRSVYTQLEYEVGRTYIKVWSYLKNTDSVMQVDERLNGRSCFMFIDKYSGAVYKPASYKAPAKGIRFWIFQLADNPDLCDPYGSFLYRS
tara:strand:- start:58 stop:495 length:438 start_codon:yes stop_codon:yes gene_type:complete